jgi:riboflavin kinase/FMN adenylyltransferase|uniref:Riboflavin biosynthesis protein n=1 Tax=uncultured bacterium BAC13K9BAC TaxID=332979 RepID=Q4JN46_9BACT|nr:predicted riboflavin biosynthesis protein [uncultured bacterium BAC13K9BAC]
MNIIEKIENISDKPKVVTIGNFDGIHKGHQSLIKKTQEISHAENLESIIFTFNMLPEEVFEQSNFQRIYNNELKFDYIKAHEINTILSINFNDIKDLSASFFCEEILIKKLITKYLVIGKNFKFGKGREGNIDKLKEYHNSGDFHLIIPELEQYDNEHISSTRVRKLLKDGKFSDVKNCLGREYMLRGTVTTGEQLGRKLGYPTANISLDYDYPLDGVYLSKVYVDGVFYHGLASVGNKPTYNGKEKILEVFILNFNQDIYNKEVEVYFLEMIRNQIKFDSQDELIKQMNEDHKYAIINSKNYGI